MLLYGMQQMPMIDFCFMIPRSHSKYVTDFGPLARTVSRISFSTLNGSVSSIYLISRCLPIAIEDI